MCAVSSSLNNILVIDEVPVIALGLQEAFRTLNPAVQTEFRENVLSALSSGIFKNTSFDLIVLGTLPDIFSDSLPEIFSDLKKKFGNPRIMLYSDQYNPVLIENMEQSGIAAYVHKFETLEEVQKAYTRIACNDLYISEMLHILYNDYHLKPDN